MVPPAYFSLGLLVCLAIVTSGQAAECPRGWLSYNGHCYGYFHQELTWSRAQASCQRYKADLATILDADEHRAIADYLHRVQWDDEDVWIGLSVAGRNQEWLWPDGSNTGYTAWKRFKPPPFVKNEPCALLDEDSGFMLWDTDSCNDRNAFLCKL
ncbi:struthiocalcin-1-like [Heteronotia binoei]|uniref:struthiocalcin-1-like n=1 Tax=Heteronotia binoei TaxID=13085 RepID=UPI00292E960E|nr:struthiocalcin-1-like [Heteronotia binoei]